MGRRSKSQPADWHPEDVKGAVRKTGITMAALARQKGFNVRGISKALERPSAPAQSIIADHIGVPPQTIWPSRYQPDGTPKLRGWPRGRRRIAVAPTPNSQNGSVS